MSTKQSWFEVDRQGLSALLERRGKTSAVVELIQNGWDAPGTTTVTILLEPIPNRSAATLIVVDDSPDGFTDLTHAFTLFAPSAKASDAEKRGRFNLGEKLVLAVCETATIRSTTGGVSFDNAGRKRIVSKRDSGSAFSATIRLNRAEIAEVSERIHQLIPPAGITTVFNGTVLQPRTPIHTFTTQLRTEIADESGVMRPTARKTLVSLYEPLGDEVPHIYEMGIPVVEWDAPWHVDIAQKVPLNFERDNVTPAYLRNLRVQVLNENFERITPEQATDVWVSDALEDEKTSERAVEAVICARFGNKAVAYDPSDQQANAEAVLQGYTVVHGRMLSKQAWSNVKRGGLLRPAGQVTPSNSTMLTSPNGTPPLSRDQWTPGMLHLERYAKALAKELLGLDIAVDVHRSMQNFAAAYGSRHLTFNLQRLGHRWFNEPDQEKVDALLIHEFAHERVADHLSEAFHSELCRLAALARTATSRLEDLR
jgi:hypothetical protein